MARISEECQAEVEAALALDATDGPNTRWKAIIAALLKHGVAYMRPLHSSEVFVHPDNRGTLGLNHHNVHRLIAKIKKVGADADKLLGATAFELSSIPGKQDFQVSFNNNLIDHSKGLLAPPTGKERYLSIATSHCAAGCRSVNAGCPTPNAHMADPTTGLLNRERALGKDLVFAGMVDVGWEYCCIPSSVEEMWPRLPVIGQAALNASNSVWSEQSELEIAATISEYAAQDTGKADIDWPLCVDAAASSAPPCLPYIEVIGKYVKQYGGGPGAPIITFLDHFAKCYGENRRLGEDFFKAVVDLEIPSDHTKYPLVHAAMIALNLSAQKVQDGFARFVLPAQIERLKAKTMKGKVNGVEDYLEIAWGKVNELLANRTFGITTCFKIFGSFAARSAMFLLGNGKLGFEKKDYKSTAELFEQFQKNIGNDNLPAEDEIAVPSDENASSAAARFADANDPKFIAKERGFIVGKNFNMKQNARIFKLMRLGDEGAVFIEEAIPVPSVTETIVPYTELRFWSEYKGKVPEMIGEVQNRGLFMNRITAERLRCEVFCSLIDIGKSHKESENCISYSLFPNTARCTEDVSKGKLTLIPSTDSPSKINLKKAGFQAEVVHGGISYQIDAPLKPTVAEQQKWPPQAMLVAYWWVQSSSDESVVNMVEKKINVGDVAVIAYVNSKKLKAGDKLFKFKPIVERVRPSPDVFKRPPAETTQSLKKKAKGAK